MPSLKSTPKALVLAMSIILDMLCVLEWSQRSLIIYVLYIKNLFLRIYKTKWTKLLTLSKASKWEMMIFVKRICIPEWDISLTHQINCSESFEGQKWSTERNYPSLNEVGPVLSMLFPVVLRKPKTQVNQTEIMSKSNFSYIEK